MTVERTFPYSHAELKRLIAPRSVAIVGASSRPGSFGRRALENLSLFDGEVYLVNPRYSEIEDQPCYPLLSALPTVPDSIIVASPSDSVEETVRDAVRLEVGGVVVFAAGYAETGDDAAAARQGALADLVRGTTTRLVGPNCLGLMNYRANARQTFSPTPRNEAISDKAIGIVSQSGALGVAVTQSVEHGAPIGYMFAAGNSCDVDVADLISFLVEEDGCSAIACILEGLSNISRFRAAAEAAWRADKPLIVYKMAVGERGAKAAMSHTGALAGTEAAYNAMFAATGVVRVENLEDLVETSVFFAKAPRVPLADGVAVLSTTGGGAIIAADKAEQYGVDLPSFSPETRTFLESIIPDFGTADNPCDLTAQALNDPNSLRECGNRLFAEPNIGALLLPHTMAEASVAHRLVQLGDQGKEVGKPFCAVWLPGWLEGPGLLEAERHDNISVFRSTDRCLGALAQWFARGARRAKGAGSQPVSTDRATRAAAREWLLAAGTSLGETVAKKVLADYGVPSPPEHLVNSVQELSSALQDVGYPCVLKLESPDVPHKTEMGVVKLGINDEAAAVGGFKEIMTIAQGVQPPIGISGVVVQPMIGAGVELFVGGRVDPLFGPMIVFGFGGVLIEVLNDSVSALAPITAERAKELLHDLRGRALLTGYRGAAPVDINAFTEIVAGASRFLADHGDLIAELDINPIIATQGRLYAVDALIVPSARECA